MTLQTAGIFALVALSPAGFNTAAWASPVIAISICGAGDAVHVVLGLPSPGERPAEGHDCPKACHAGGSRKRVSGEMHA